ncbi:endonuclease domain-containing protein [Microbacterium sp.]|uniref:endonuclease domain-containing protein n=1 Tax=Microbacterium sp. TaxID=51671 RepID=UPI003F966799
MRTRRRLPARLGDSFSVGGAQRAGVGRSRRDADDLHRPFHGMRSTRIPETFRQVVDCYRPRLRPEHLFSGRTAARLWGLPLPWHWKKTELLDVVVPLHLSPPTVPGVRGHRLAAHKLRPWTVAGAAVVDAVTALFTCASELTVPEAVTMLDALLTTADDYPDLGPGRPLATMDEITQRLAEWGRFPGSGTVRKAAPLARTRVESPKETATRLLIRDAGFPEPAVQHEVRDGGRFVARVDLAYPELRIAIEYEGDGHRTDKEQWRSDIRRQRDLEDCGWIVIRLTQSDLDDHEALVARLHHAISAQAV